MISNNSVENKIIIETQSLEDNDSTLVSRRDLFWIIGLAIVGSTINYLPYSNKISIAYQILIAAIVVLGNLKRPVMLIVAFIFLNLMPSRIAGGFNTDIGAFYTVNQRTLSFMIFAFIIANIFLSAEKHKGKFNYWQLAFAAFISLSYLWTISTIYYDSSFVWMVAAYIFYSYFITTKKDLILILFSFFVYILIFCIAVLPQIINGNLYRGIVNLDPNYTSFIVLLGLMTAVMLFTQNKEKLRIFLRILLIAGIVLDLILMGIFASRTAFVCLAVILLMYLVINLIKVSRIVITGILSIIAFFALNKAGFFDTIIVRFSESDVTSGNGRLLIWEELLKSFGKFNAFRMIFGNGYLTTGIFGLGEGTQAHNTYLSLLIGFGFIGLFIFLGYQISSFVSIIKKKAFIYLLPAVCLLVYSFSLEPYLIPEGLIFFVMLGSIAKINTETEPENNGGTIK